jgi:hypothetical protein
VAETVFAEAKRIKKIKRMRADNFFILTLTVNNKKLFVKREF